MSDPSQPTQPLTDADLARIDKICEGGWTPAGLDQGRLWVTLTRHREANQVLEQAAILAVQTKDEVVKQVSRLRAEKTAQAERLAAGEASDGYHTHNELYDYRMLYNAHAAAGWLAAGHRVVKSWKHSDGELCFGGGWFVVAAELPTGQVTNHYEAKHWALFNVPEETPPAYDGHTPAEAADRLRSALGLDQDGEGQANG